MKKDLLKCSRVFLYPQGCCWFYIYRGTTVGTRHVLNLTINHTLTTWHGTDDQDVHDDDPDDAHEDICNDVSYLD